MSKRERRPRMALVKVRGQTVPPQRMRGQEQATRRRLWQAMTDGSSKRFNAMSALCREIKRRSGLLCPSLRNTSTCRGWIYVAFCGFVRSIKRTRITADGEPPLLHRLPFCNTGPPSPTQSVTGSRCLGPTTLPKSGSPGPIPCDHLPVEAAARTVQD